MRNWKNHFARQVTFRRAFRSVLIAGVLMGTFVTAQNAQAGCLLRALFSPFCGHSCFDNCYSPCAAPCGVGCFDSNPCPCSTLPYVPAYSYQPYGQPMFAQSMWSGASGCGCDGGAHAVYPGALHQPGYPVTGTSMAPATPTTYSSVSFQNSPPVISAPIYSAPPQATGSYSEWTSVPATGGQSATLKGVIVEPGDTTYNSYPINPINEEMVPKPYDQSYVQPQSYESRDQVKTSSTPQERVANARALRERFASKKMSKFERLSRLNRNRDTHTNGGGVQYDHRSSVKAPTAAIVWQTP